MLYSRVSSGLDFLDASVGGLYSNRCYLVRGPAQSGRTTMALQFLQAGVENGESGIMISSDRLENVILKAEAMGISLEQHLMDNKLILMEYPKVILGRQYTYGTIIQLLGEIEQYIKHYNCSRLVFDTLHPLLTTPSQPQLVNYVYSLMNSLEALNVTSIVTTGEPNSQTAQRMIQLIEDAAVGSFAISVSGKGEDVKRKFNIVKMINKMNPPVSFNVKFEHGIGLIQDMQKEKVRPGKRSASAQSVSLEDLPVHICILDHDEDAVHQVEEIFHQESTIRVFESESELQPNLMNLDVDIFMMNANNQMLNWRRLISNLRESYPKLPILLYLDKKNPQLSYQTAKLAGADGLLIKPFVPKDIIKLFEKTLHAYGTFEELIETRSMIMEPGSLPEDISEPGFKIATEEEDQASSASLMTPSAFKAVLNRQIWRGKQEDANFALISFKMVYISAAAKLPHMPQGLELVKKVSQIITSSLRGINDSACRYMDKVVVLLEDTNREGAKAFANRVIKDLQEELSSKLDLKIGAHLNVLTAFATFPDESDNVNDLMALVTDVSRNFIKLHN